MSRVPIANWFRGLLAVLSLSPALSAQSEGQTPAPAKLLNISTRLRVLTGDEVLVGGFIVTGSEPKRIIVRGIGPSLVGVGPILGDPTLELHNSSTILAINDNWKVRPDGSSQQAEIEATTIPPSNDLESALVATLDPGAYTAILAGKNNSIGVGLVEVYDLTSAADSKLANISTRGFVNNGDNVMIGGFIVGGDESATVMMRAIGPSLSEIGVEGALADPILELHDATGATLASNDNWKRRSNGSSQQAEIIATHIPPSNDLESALVQNLAPGSYTVVVGGNNGTTGIGLVEVYHLETSMCQPVVNNYPLQPGIHVPVGTVITSWNSNPPSSGEHYPIWGKWNHTNNASAPLPRGYYVHNQEHGGVVLLYNCPEGCPDEISAMQAIMADLPPDPLCAAPGVSTRTLITADPALPSGIRFAAAAWGFTYTADCFDVQSMRDFILAHYAQGPEDTCADGVIYP
jgi:hypothetical protein